MTLNVNEFIRRFLLHILPKGFVRIRSSGFLANGSYKNKLQRAKRLLKCAVQEIQQRITICLKELSDRLKHNCIECHKGVYVFLNSPKLRFRFR